MTDHADVVRRAIESQVRFYRARVRREPNWDTVFVDDRAHGANIGHVMVVANPKAPRGFFWSAYGPYAGNIEAALQRDGLGDSRFRSRGRSGGRADGVVLIEYGAVPNKRKGEGFLPLIWENGHPRGNTYASRGYDEDVAERMAEREARERAARYVGDWKVTVRARPKSGRAGGSWEVWTLHGGKPRNLESAHTTKVEADRYADHLHKQFGEKFVVMPEAEGTGRSRARASGVSFRRGDRVQVRSYSRTFGEDWWTGTVVTGNVSMRLWEGIGSPGGGWDSGSKREPHLYVRMDSDGEARWYPVRDLRAAPSGRSSGRGRVRRSA